MEGGFQLQVRTRGAQIGKTTRGNYERFAKYGQLPFKAIFNATKYGQLRYFQAFHRYQITTKIVL